MSDAPCEYPYGTNPHCTTMAHCYDGSWSLQKPDPSCDQNPSSCPASFDAGNTDMCTNELCTYEAGRCSCNSCTPQVCSPPCRTRDSGTEWYCWPWEFGEQPGCSTARPLLGTACFGVDASSICSGIWDPSMTCVGGYWVTPSGGC